MAQNYNPKWATLIQNISNNIVGLMANLDALETYCEQYIQLQAEKAPH